MPCFGAVRLAAMAVVLVAAGNWSCRATTDPPTSPGRQAPPVVTVLREQGGKPPMENYILGLSFTNAQPVPVWLMFPDYADRDIVVRHGRIGADSGYPHSIEGTEYVDDHGRPASHVIVVTDVGEFDAIRVPAHGSIRFAGFRADSVGKVRSIHAMTSSTLLVNGRTPLEQWLPYETTNDATTKVTAVAVGIDHIPKSLEWDPKRSAPRTDLPTEEVRFIGVDVLDYWVIPFDAPSQKP